MFKTSEDFQVLREWINEKGQKVKHCRKGKHEIIAIYANKPSDEALERFNTLLNRYAWEYANR